MYLDLGAPHGNLVFVMETSNITTGFLGSIGHWQLTREVSSPKVPAKKAGKICLPPKKCKKNQGTLFSKKSNPIEEKPSSTLSLTKSFPQKWLVNFQVKHCSGLNNRRDIQQRGPLIFGQLDRKTSGQTWDASTIAGTGGRFPFLSQMFWKT